MGEKHTDRLAKLPRTVIIQYAALLALCLGVNLLRASQDGTAWGTGRHLASDLVTGFICVAVTLGISRHSRKEAAAKARDQGKAPRDVMAAELYSGLGIGAFLPVYGFMATGELGWAWGAPFYGICMLHGAYLLLRWRRYVRTVEVTG